jgi:hypothetical protein
MKATSNKSPATALGAQSDAAPRIRLNVRVAADVGRCLDALAKRERRMQSDLVEAALLSFLSPDATDKRDAAVTRRLDRQSRQLQTLHHDLAIITETLALFIRYFMSVTPGLPESQQAAARAKGAERFAAFVDTLGKRLSEGKPLLGDLHLNVRPTVDDFRSADEIADAGPENRHATA